MPLWKQLDCLTQRHGCSLDERNCVWPWGGKKRHCCQNSPHLTCHNPFNWIYNHIPFCASLTDKDTRHSYAHGRGSHWRFRACCILHSLMFVSLAKHKHIIRYSKQHEALQVGSVFTRQAQWPCVRLGCFINTQWANAFVTKSTYTENNVEIALTALNSNNKSH